MVGCGIELPALGGSKECWVNGKRSSINLQCGSGGSVYINHIPVRSTCSLRSKYDISLNTSPTIHINLNSSSSFWGFWSVIARPFIIFWPNVFINYSEKIRLFLKFYHFQKCILIPSIFILLILGERKIQKWGDVDLMFHLVVHSLVASCICPDGNGTHNLGISGKYSTELPTSPMQGISEKALPKILEPRREITIR